MSGTNIRKILLDGFSIVLAVLLALGVDEWREDREQAKQVETALLKISQELNSNLEVLKLIHDNNTVTVAAMSASSESDKELPFIPGIQLRNTAWDTITATGVANFIDLETMYTLSYTYSILRVYKQTGVQLTGAALNVSAYAAVAGKDVDEKDFQKQFRTYFEMIVTVESELLKTLEKSIRHLEVKA